MILFVVALPNELKILKNEIKKIDFYFGEIKFLLTGVGNLNTIYKIKDYISKNKKPDFIVNIGICGKKDENFNDFFQVYKIKNSGDDKEIICPVYLNFLSLKQIICSNKILTDKKEMGKYDFVDMESVGIDFVCTKEKIPYTIIKKPFDIVSKGSKNINLNNFLDGFPFKRFFEEINKFFKENAKKYDFENNIDLLTKKHKLTFSQREFLKRYINRQISFLDDKVILKLESYGKEKILEKICLGKY